MHMLDNNVFERACTFPTQAILIFIIFIQLVRKLIFQTRTLVLYANEVQKIKFHISKIMGPFLVEMYCYDLKANPFRNER